MRRLGGILFSALNILSLVLFPATVALWVRQAFSDGPFVLVSGQARVKAVEVYASRGAMVVYVGSAPLPDSSKTGVIRRGFFVATMMRVYLINGTAGTLMQVQFWCLAALTAFTPLATTIPIVRVVRRRHRAKRFGLCPSCGYDLRATPDRCPECGAVAAISLRNSEVRP